MYAFVKGKEQVSALPWINEKKHMKNLVTPVWGTALEKRLFLTEVLKLKDLKSSGHFSKAN